MFTTVPGVPAAPPAYGLVASAVPITAERWEQGLVWVPERCGTAFQLLPWCDAPPVGYDPPRPGTAYYRPPGLRIADECSTLSGPVDEERVRRVADAQSPFAVARELWDGALTQADLYEVGGQDRSNAYLASPDAELVTATGGPLAGLGALEQAALEGTHGQPVMLHIPVKLAWLVAGSLFRVGQTLLTAAGNVVVADAGYPGTGPTGQQPGATLWAYATSPVAYAASQWALIADDASTVDRAVNTRTVWAQRVFAATFDPCAHFAAEISI